jgi:uncharacterized protein YukE
MIAKPIIFKPMPPDLTKVEHGRYAERLKYLRGQSSSISPEEIYLALDPARVEGVTRAQFARWGDRLQAWRNGLILLPLLITWISLGLAVFAYAQTYSVHSGQPFLKQWVDGFPGTGVLVPSFVVVVVVVAVLLAILLVLTVCVQSIKSRAYDRAARLRSWLEDELYTLASTSLVRSLGPGVESKRPQWAVEVHTALSSLNSVLENMKAVIGASQQSFAETIDRFADTYQQQNQSVDRLLQNTHDIEAAITQLLAMKDIYLRLESVLPEMGRHSEIMAQSVVHIADQLANQPQYLSVASEGDVVLNISRVKGQRDFDVFLCYDGKDKLAVKAIAEQLKKHGIKPWLDEWEIAPGMPWQSVLEEQISRIRSVAVFLGQDALGPWQNLELRTLLQEFVERGCPVIPVILPGYDGVDPDLPPFLRSLTWVDFRQKEPDPLERLTWGVTGRR